MQATHPLPLFVQAVAFAAEKHRHQRRKDAQASPYINHPIALAQVLAQLGGVHDPVVLCAAVLHDTLEDTETTAEELQALFGAPIAAVVQEVTDDKSLPKPARKQAQIEHAATLSPAARLVKLADKICNLSDILAHPPQGWDAARRQQYFDWAARVVQALGPVHPGLEQRFAELLARRAELA
ncbi:HD domain-containing protein [Inhella proteolytica]|uniref:Bifunctional (P)ppGpp synthetase/guanosine-3',5'-bis(Diphosphate) 3'-pyrophosphohydrolase n=1 Tax=Inhella proteolytica TaxID=2795029 RepID=A0A931J770_9BURK|nr:HD domain-containing protein [Inhella proteolytica]MBH9579506.1 bifunctional (p)ppGpp synthetase/guanosine-3',5'-bis(diphosphate) 3'-pyrophosphohydrolase [Inhella proteolytica]